MTDFDPLLYAADVKANPQNYVLVSDCVAEVMAQRAIRHAKNLTVLKAVFQLHAKNARGNDELTRIITEAKETRKQELGGKK